MRKQTQSRQYGYVSPKCKFVRLEHGFCLAASNGYGDGRSSGTWISGGNGVNDYSSDDNLL